MKTGTKIFLAAWATATVIGWCSSPFAEPEVTFGFGIGRGIWVPLIYGIFLLARKAYLWLLTE